MSISFNPFLSKRLYSDVVISLSPGPFSYLTSIFDKKIASVVDPNKIIENLPSREELLKAGIRGIEERFDALYPDVYVDLQGKDYVFEILWSEHPRHSRPGESWMKITSLALKRKRGERHETVVCWERNEDDVQSTKFVRGAAENPRTAELLDSLFLRLYEADYLDEDTKADIQFFALALKQAGYL